MLGKCDIIMALHNVLEPLPYVYALWLEGADANGTADEYSDMDVWVDVEDAYEDTAYEAVETALSALAEIDYRYVVPHSASDTIRFRKYHLAGTSEYLVIDCQWQLHSRPVEEYTFFEGNTIEAAKVIFDKVGVIRYTPLDIAAFAQPNRQRLEEAMYRMAQLMRVKKYILREQYLEAFDNYNCYVLQSLADVLRLIYTPAHAHYYLTHISRHIPASASERLAYFARIGSLHDMAERLPQAAQWFRELVEMVETVSE